MASLTTRCPQCGTAFKVVADQLRVRQGLVRCGVCSAVFDGYARLIDGAQGTPGVPAAPAAPAVAHPVTPPVHSAPVPLPPVTSTSSAGAPTAPAPAPTAPAPAPTAPVSAYAPPAPDPVDDATPPWAMPRATPKPAPEPAVLRDRSHASRRTRDDDDQGDDAYRDADREPDQNHDHDRDLDRYRDPDRDRGDRDPQAGVSGRGVAYPSSYRNSGDDDQAAGLRAAGMGYVPPHADAGRANDYRSSEPHHTGYRSDDYASKAYLLERDDGDDHTLAGAPDRDDDERTASPATANWPTHQRADGHVDRTAVGTSDRNTPPVADRPARNPRFDLSEDDDAVRDEGEGDAPYIPAPAVSPWDNRREPAVFTQPRAANRPADQWGRTGQPARNAAPRDAAFYVDDNEDDAPDAPAPEHDERYAPHARDIRPNRVTLDDDLADDNMARDGRDDEWDDEDQDAGPAVRGETRVRHAGDPYAGATPPEFMDDEVERQGALGRWFWGTLCVLALIALVLASIWTYRNAIVTSAPQLRPVMAQLCVRLGCEVGYARRIDRIAILSSSLQPPAGGFASEPGRNRLIMRAVIRNRYNMPQPLPALTLELTDFSDTIVARKVLRPEMYLPANLAAQPFAAEGELSVAVPIDVTDLQVNGYQIGKFFP